jgi:hypothetical protein
MKVTKKAIKEFVRNKLATDERWAKKALVTVFNNQTLSEQEGRCTSNLNGVGFGAFDADILTGLCAQYIRKDFLTPKQMDIVFKKMPRYWAQIIQASDYKKLEAMVAATL